MLNKLLDKITFKFHTLFVHEEDCSVTIKELKRLGVGHVEVTALNVIGTTMAISFNTSTEKWNKVRRELKVIRVFDDEIPMEIEDCMVYTTD